MFIVLRAFKERGILFEAGSVIADLSSVKYYRSRLGCRDIVELSKGDKHNQLWIEYLQNRGVTVDPAIIDFCKVTSTVAKSTTPVAKPTATKTTTVKTPVAKVVAKTAVK